MAVIGGSDSAVEEAIYLTKFAEKVYLIHRRDKLRASKIIQDRAFSNSKINFIWNSIPVEISGNNNVDSILISNVIDKNQEKIKIDGVFVFIGYEPDTEFVKDIIDRDKEGYIITDVNMKTNTNGKKGNRTRSSCRKSPYKNDTK